MSKTVQGLQEDFNQTATTPSPQEVTAYFRAAAAGDLAGVQSFVEAYPGSVDVTDFNSMAHARGLSTGLSALQLAALNDRVAILNYLIDNGADIEQSNNSKWTPLIHAAASGHVGATAALLAKAHQNPPKQVTAGMPSVLQKKTAIILIARR